MTDNNNININSSKPSEFDFNIHVQGISTDDPRTDTTVRFVIYNTELNMDLAFPCTSADDSDSTLWKVKFPQFDKLLKQSSYQFRVEVIVDGYYFEPANGTLIFVGSPTIEMSKTSPVKEQVSITNNVELPIKKVEIDTPKIKIPDVVDPIIEKVLIDNPTISAPTSKDKAVLDVLSEFVKEQAVQNSDVITPATTATNRLLMPEFKPEDTTMVNIEDKKVSDELEDDPTKLSGKVMPTKKKAGVSTSEVITTITNFDPTQIAKTLVKEHIKVSIPTTKGSLFTRGSDGKPIVLGLESEETKAILKKNANIVKTALKS